MPSHLATGMDLGPKYDPAALNALMRPPRVCVCRNVSLEQLRSAIRAGAHTFEDLQEVTRCSTGCGTCEPKVRQILADELSAARLP